MYLSFLHFSIFFGEKYCFQFQPLFAGPNIPFRFKSAFSVSSHKDAQKSGLSIWEALMEWKFSLILYRGAQFTMWKDSAVITENKKYFNYIIFMSVTIQQFVKISLKKHKFYIYFDFWAQLIRIRSMGIEAAHTRVIDETKTNNINIFI